MQTHGRPGKREVDQTLEQQQAYLRKTAWIHLWQVVLNKSRAFAVLDAWTEVFGEGEGKPIDILTSLRPLILYLMNAFCTNWIVLEIKERD